MKELKKLVKEFIETRKEIQRLCEAFDYELEDKAIRSLPKILKEKYNIEIIEELKRGYLKISGKDIKVNIYGKVKKDEEEYILIGAAKSEISKKIIDNFIKKCRKISKKSIKVLVSYKFPPEIKKYAEKKGIILILSYELKR